MLGDPFASGKVASDNSIVGTTVYFANNEAIHRFQGAGDGRYANARAQRLQRRAHGERRHDPLRQSGCGIQDTPSLAIAHRIPGTIG